MAGGCVHAKSAQRKAIWQEYSKTQMPVSVPSNAPCPNEISAPPSRVTAAKGYQYSMTGDRRDRKNLNVLQWGHGDTRNGLSKFWDTMNMLYHLGVQSSLGYCQMEKDKVRVTCTMGDSFM